MDIETYGAYSGRICSEYGMQALPELASIQRFAPNSSHMGDATLQYHQKHHSGSYILGLYI